MKGRDRQTHHSNNETRLAMRPGVTPEATNYQFTFSFDS